MAPRPVVIDLSHHNVIPTDLKATRKAGVLGLIHKCTENTGFVDSKYEARRWLALDAGMLFGAYHFLRPGNIAQQAKFFVDEAQPDPNTLLAADHEDAGVSLTSLLEFLQRVEDLTGVSPVIYSGHVLKEQLSGPHPLISRYRLWLAQYGTSPTLPPGFTRYWLWQYTDRGAVPGVTPETDLNDFQGTEAELREQWPGWPDVAPAPTPKPTVLVRIVAPPGVEVVVDVERT